MEVPKVGQQQALPGMESAERGEPGHRYICSGKEVQCDGQHYADAISSDAAERVTLAMNALDVQEDWAHLIAAAK